MTSDRLAESLSPAVVEGLLEVMLAEPGPETLRLAVKNAGTLIGAMCCFVCEVSPENPEKARTLVLWRDGEFDANVEYSIQGTPCSGLVENEFCLIEQGVQELFPNDGWLVDVGAESYAGVRLRTNGAHHLGHLSIVNRTPLDQRVFEQDTFRLFAALVRAELVSRHSEARRLEAERKLLEGHRLQSLGVLAGGVAHDFNNLLVGITGNTELALDQLTSDSNVRQCLIEIDASAHRAAELARQMLAYSGKGRFVITETHLRPLVEQTLDILRSSIPPSATILTEFASDSPTVRIDATQIGQLVMNLVLNAVDALHDSGGTIRVSTGVVDADRETLDDAVIGSGHPPGKRAHLLVEDDGIGMSDEVRKRIFEPFFTNKPDGRGLGLAAVHGIVEGHDASLLLESSQGRGTSFRVLLNTSPVASIDSPPSATPADTLRDQAVVLVVDDDETVRRATTSMLEHLGCKVLSANTGEQGVAVFETRENQIDLILLDVTMPGMNGEETLRAIHALDPRARIVLTSGYDEREAITARVGEGLAGFLQKPFGLRDLEKEVGALRE